MTVSQAVQNSDNLSFYHKVLLPGLLLVLAGMAGSQVYLIQSIAEIKTQITYLSENQKNQYSMRDAANDWKYQSNIDSGQDKRMDSLELQIKSHATQIYNIRKSE